MALGIIAMALAFHWLGASDFIKLAPKKICLWYLVCNCNRPLQIATSVAIG